MDIMNLSKEQLMNAVHLVAAMTVTDLSKILNKPSSEMFLSFMESRTAQILYDTETRFWCDGPAAVEAAYLEEIGA